MPPVDDKEQKEQQPVSDPKPQHTIRSVISKAEKKIDPSAGKVGMDEIKDVLKKKQKERIVNAALGKYQQSEELKPYQAELIKLQQHIEQAGKKMIILFDGRDASGKGGTIRRLTRYMNEKRYRIEVPGKPSQRQQSELHMKRYIERFPAVGEIVLFDRSWYNRAGVERVMGFCTEEEHQYFLHACPQFERMLIQSGTILIKYWFSVSDEEQERRFQGRIDNPTKQWKLSPMDLESRNRWLEYSRAKDEMFAHTDVKHAPWYVVEADSKKRARLNCIHHLLSMIPYEDITPDPVKLPARQSKGGYVRPPLSEQTFVPDYMD